MESKPMDRNGTGREMRCLACGVEMQLVRAVADATAPVPGYAHHTFECPGCHDTETRLVFSREPVEAVPALRPGPPRREEAAPEPASDLPVPAAGDAHTEASSAWARALDLLRSRQGVLAGQAAGPAPGESPRHRLAMPRRREAPAVPRPPAAAAAATQLPLPASAWARAVAMLRRRQERQ
jgi:hypothetical protein